MLACHECRRFVREESSRCPFCDAALVADRAPLGGFLGVLLGVSLAGCAGSGDDEDGTASQSASGTLTVASDSSSDSTTIGNDTSSATEVSGPLYGPVTFDTSGDETSGGSETSGSDSDSTGTGTDTGDATTGASESAGPLYGPATGN